MTMQDAANLFTVSKAEQEVLGDPTLNMWGKMRALTALQNAAARPADNPGFSISAGDVARGAIGAGIGYGVGAVMGRMFGVSDSTKTVFKGLGMGLGTILNMGSKMNKNGSDDTERRHAFRMGFMNAVLDLDLMKTANGLHPVLPISPDLISSPVNAGLSMGAGVASNTGGLIGQLVGADDTDLAVEKMQLEQRALEGQAEGLESQRRQAALKRVLGKRVAAR